MAIVIDKRQRFGNGAIERQVEQAQQRAIQEKRAAAAEAEKKRRAGLASAARQRREERQRALKASDVGAQAAATKLREEWLRDRMAEQLARRMAEAKAIAERLNARSSGAKRSFGKVAWADDKAIRAIYRHARALNESTSAFHEVDHVVPLVHPLVCGLHVETNLRIVVRVENQVKSNRWTPVTQFGEQAGEASAIDSAAAYNSIASY